jgi:PadR family transcriptional regulator PadR
MPPKAFLGEFEHMVLLAVLQLKTDAYGPRISRILEERAGRDVSRGALYATLDRLEQKGFLEWEIEAATSRRQGNRQRRFTVTPAGIKALTVSREALVNLWRGIEDTLTA